MLYREFLSHSYRTHPELFPTAWQQGFTFHDAYQSTKTSHLIRRVKLKATKAVFALRPSFLMPYHTAHTDAVEKALYLLQFGVPFSALVYVFGRDEMYWYRLFLQLGRPNLVGTTVKEPAKLPRHLVADEKQSWIAKAKVFIPTTVAGGVFLGATVVTQADTAQLTKGYQEFQAEATALDPAYQPTTVCTDGFFATRKAWRALFPTVTLVLCFLHLVLKLRDRCRGLVRQEVLDRAWHIYAATDKRSFSQRARRFKEWASAKIVSVPLMEVAAKLHERTSHYLTAFDYPAAHRTSNAVDRLMNYQDRKLYAMRYFHHSTTSARLMVRAIAMLWNFHPYSERLRRQDKTRRSPFCDLNGFQYHGNWLHNFLIASSMGGLRA
ncbi:MAG: transposase [Pyrinomonadaceae bacterium]|nr:transposase [Pyrinomonadaceae bacterium]